MDRRELKRLAIALSALAVGWGAHPAWVPAQPAVPALQIRAAAAVAVSEATKPEEIIESVFRQPDRVVLRSLSHARQLLEADRAGEAVQLLQSILNAPEDFFFQPDKKSSLRLSLKGEAQRLIGRMSRDGRWTYQTSYGPHARTLLQKATAAGDPQVLAEVSRRFFHTEAGYEATLMLGLDHLDHGRPLAAGLTLRRLLENCPEADRFEPTLSLAMATCWVRSGMPDLAHQTLAALKQKQRGPTARIGGREVRWFADEGEALSWLVGLTGPQAPAGPTELEQWAMLRGNPSRTAFTSGGAPLLNMRWRVPTSDHPLIDSMIRRIKENHEEQGLPSLPGLHPLAVDNMVLMRTARNLIAIDFITGKREWEVPVNDSLETVLRSGNSPIALGQTSQFHMGLAQRVWQDATYGSMSSDGNRVFSVEDLGAGNPMGRASYVIINGRRQKNPAGPKSHNRLAAHDIRTGKLKWHVGGGADEFSLPLSDSFFLGPPLPLMGQLYVLAEIKSEIKLLVLDGKTGRLVWSQQLAPVENGRTNRHVPNVRRMSGVSPSYGDGILICPTSNGAIVAVDMATRSLLWGYPFAKDMGSSNRSRMIAMRMGRISHSGQQDPGRWADGNPIIVDGRVLVAPLDSQYLHCLNLADGRLMWRHPRENGRYVACVHNGKVIVVGADEVRALKLNVGNDQQQAEPAWEGRKIALPEGASPSGQGFASGGQYFLPLSTAAVAAIDLDAGKIGHVAKSRSGSVPGNLVCYKGRVISQGPDGVEVFYQLEALRTLAESRLKTDPVDPEALALRGEILLDSGKRPEAIVALRRSYALAADPRTRDLLRSAMFEGLEADFVRHRGMTDEIERLIDNPQQRATYLRLMATGFLAVGELPAALSRYLELSELDAEEDGLETVSKVLLVRRDRWVRARLAELRRAAPSEFRPEIDKAVETRLEAALKADDVESLRQFLRYFDNHPAANRGRRQLIARLIKSGQLLEAELLLRQEERCGEPARVAAAVAQTAELLRGARQFDDAAVYYRRLDKELAGVVCLDGRTGRQIVEALPAESEIKTLLASRSPWPVGRVEVKTGTPKAPRTSYHGRFVLAYEGSPKPFFSDKSILFDQNRRMILARDGLGRECWKPIAMFKSGAHRNSFMAHNRGLTKAKVEGHLLVLSVGSLIQAYDTLGLSDGEGPRVIWSQDLTATGTGRSAMTAINLGAANQMMIQRMLVARHRTSANNRLGPVTDRFVCFQRLRHLTAVDSRTGDTLWTRSDIPPGSDLLGDNEYVLAVPPGKPHALVVRALDGHLLGKRDLPKFQIPDLPAMPVEGDATGAISFRQYSIGTIGRNLLIWRLDGKGRVLQLFDLWEQKGLWKPRAFHANAKYARLGNEAIGVLEPNGHFTLVSLSDGRTVFEANVQPEPSLAGIHLLHHRDRYFLVAHSPNRPGMTARRSQPLPGTRPGVVASGRVYAFDERGAMPWPKPIEIQHQQLLLDQPSRLPVLMFACQVYERVNNRGRYHVAIQAIDKRSGQKLPDRKFKNSTSVFSLVGDPEKKTVEVITQKDSLTMTFTDQPVLPATEEKKEPPSIGTAIFRALGKAIGSDAVVPVARSGDRPQQAVERKPAAKPRAPKEKK